MPNILPGTGVLILITVLASIYAWKTPNVFHKWLMNPYSVNKRNEYFRFITSGFIHNDWGHLIFNMISLYFMGIFLEVSLVRSYGEIPGWALYGGYYILGIVISEIPTYLKNKNNPHYNSLGASGGVSAVIFSVVVLVPKAQLYVFFIPMPAVVFGLLFLAYSYYMSKRGGDYINHDAHLYGAIFGIIATVILFPQQASNFFYEITHW